MKAYVDEIESPAGPLAFAVNEDGALVRLHFIESDYGPVMEEDLEDEGYAVEAGRDQDRWRPKRVGRVCERASQDLRRAARVRRLGVAEGRLDGVDAHPVWGDQVLRGDRRLPRTAWRGQGRRQGERLQRLARSRTLPPCYRCGRHARRVQRWPTPQGAFARARAQRTRRGGQLVCRKGREGNTTFFLARRSVL